MNPSGRAIDGLFQFTHMTWFGEEFDDVEPHRFLHGIHGRHSGQNDRLNELRLSAHRCQQFQVEPRGAALSEADRAVIARYRWHLGAIVAYAGIQERTARTEVAL